MLGASRKIRPRPSHRPRCNCEYREREYGTVTSLHRDFLPSAWGMFYPTFWDWATLIGSLGFFFTLLLLFVRFLPAISVYEMRELVAERKGISDEPPSARPLRSHGGIRKRRGTTRRGAPHLCRGLPRDRGLLTLPGGGLE
jgi:hypothetical protein